MFNKIKEYFNLNTKYPKCNCASIKDQEIVIAESIHLSTILRIKVIDGVNKYKIDDKLWYSLYNKKYNKKACIACGTCLGWYNSEGKSIDPYIIADNIIKEATEYYDKCELAKKICKGEQ